MRTERTSFLDNHHQPRPSAILERAMARLAVQVVDETKGVRPCRHHGRHLGAELTAAVEGILEGYRAQQHGVLPQELPADDYVDAECQEVPA